MASGLTHQNHESRWALGKTIVFGFSRGGTPFFYFLNSNPENRVQVFEPKLRTPCLAVTRTCTEASPACLIEPRLYGAAISAPPRFVFQTSFGEQYRSDMGTRCVPFNPVRRYGSVAAEQANLTLNQFIL
jgi:hypothetical protein